MIVSNRGHSSPVPYWNKKKEKRKRGYETPWKPREIIPRFSPRSSLHRHKTKREFSLPLSLSRLAANLTADPIGDEHVGKRERKKCRKRERERTSKPETDSGKLEGMGKRQGMEAVTPCTFDETNLINGPGRSTSRKEDTCARSGQAHGKASRIVQREASSLLPVLITILTSSQTNVYVHTGKGFDRGVRAYKIYIEFRL